MANPADETLGGFAMFRINSGRALPLALIAGVLAVPPAAAADAVSRPRPPGVVVATFDTGTNPFHPCFRRPGQAHPRQRIPTYPRSSRALPLKLASTYEASLAGSRKALAAIEPETLYHVPGTNISFYGGPRAKDELVDTYPHGAQASSQIACAQFGMAPDAQLVVVNWYTDTSNHAAMLRWVAQQPWIDVVHLNIQDVPIPTSHAGIKEVIGSGKMVVIAAGNGVLGAGANYPMELSSYNAPPGSLIAGANDNGGYTYFSNLDPHVVMDGMGTVAAAPHSFGTAGFSGTSSASPRITGYVARLVADLRGKYGHSGDGLVRIPKGRPRPRSGPLSDGVLTPAELHEVVRKTATPNPHASKYDGTGGGTSIPQPADLPAAFYPKMGYGEVSEHTVAAALAVLTGAKPMPARPVEDAFYTASESLRR